VLEAGASQDSCANAALEELCRTYWYPIYCFARRRGEGPEDAQDLTQEFFKRLIAPICRSPAAAVNQLAKQTHENHISRHCHCWLGGNAGNPNASAQRPSPRRIHIGRPVTTGNSPAGRNGRRVRPVYGTGNGGGPFSNLLVLDSGGRLLKRLPPRLYPHDADGLGNNADARRRSGSGWTGAVLPGRAAVAMSRKTC